MKQRINLCKKIILEAGEFLLKNFYSIDDNSIEFKTEKDLVTKIDKQTENFIINNIKQKFPNDNIFAEESINNTGLDFKGITWIIDPLDGTANYIHKLPFFSISIAIMKNTEILSGMVYLPKLNELFIAEKNKGSFLNDKPIQVSKRDKFVNCMAVTGFACLRSNLKENNLPNFNIFAPLLRGIRRFGSAAADLCYVACGRFDFFWEINLQPWDVSAGALLVKEAGGIISDFQGNTDNSFIDKKQIIASNPYIYNSVKEKLLF